MLLHVALNAESGLVWLRWTCAVSALIPWHCFLVKESIADDLEGVKTTFFRRNVLWLVVSLLLSILCHTDFFIPSYSTPLRRLYGFGYYVYIAGVLGLYAYLLRDASRKIKTLSGGRCLELQVWLGGGCATAAMILALMVAGAFTHDSRYIRLQPLVILVFYAGTAWAITMHRIFDARQLLLVVTQRLGLVLTVALGAYLLDTILSELLVEPFALLITTALSLWFASMLNSWLNQLLRFYPQALQARQAAFNAAREELRPEHLERLFCNILSGWGQADHAMVLSGAKESFRGGGIEILENSPVLRALRQLRWATPERLARERPTTEREALGAFLNEQRLGVLVISEGPSLAVLVGVGVPASRRPFTYPQVTQLMELASIMESALERAHYSAKAQRAEQLATVGLLGASLAHEIRNPLVTIKTFVQLLPQHHQDPAFREKFFSLISGEVDRIDRLTEQLLDLAAPRTYTAEPLNLHPVVSASLDLVATKAAHRDLRIVRCFEAETDWVLTDASAVKQVLLNLCFNAIQAIECHTGERWLRVTTRCVPMGVELSVSDSGPGIAPEIRPRLFQPFASTKSSGFGLGLAICSDILSGLKATITVDPSAPGCGATFRVIFPCPPPTS
ncbi:MAG: hypothetical protein HZA31_05130 [Opitutae bacterium]|nr:hypothetical protein [Opitutae bacterium]